MWHILAEAACVCCSKKPQTLFLGGRGQECQARRLWSFHSPVCTFVCQWGAPQSVVYSCGTVHCACLYITFGCETVYGSLLFFSITSIAWINTSVYVHMWEFLDVSHALSVDDTPSGFGVASPGRHQQRKFPSLVVAAAAAFHGIVADLDISEYKKYHCCGLRQALRMMEGSGIRD